MKKKYELVLVLPSGMKAEEQDKLEEKLKKDIAAAEGQLLEVKDLGKKDLAYPIKKEVSGLYKYYLLELSTDTVAPFRRKLQLNDNILRFLLVIKD